MKKYSILFISLFAMHVTFGQAGSIYVEVNYNTFAHSSLKSFQEEFINDISQVPLETNDNFPANVGFTIGYMLNSINTSFFFSYNTTGGKISYSDFSGKIRLTQPLNGYTIGGNYLIDILENGDEKNFKLGLKGFYTFSTLKIESYNQLLDAITEESIGLKSTDFGVGASLIYEYPVSFFKIRATIGVDVVLGGKLLFDENKDFHLEDNSGDAVNTGWTGLRTGLGISIPL